MISLRPGRGILLLERHQHQQVSFYLSVPRRNLRYFSGPGLSLSFCKDLSDVSTQLDPQAAEGLGAFMITLAGKEMTEIGKPQTCRSENNIGTRILYRGWAEDESLFGNVCFQFKLSICSVTQLLHLCMDRLKRQAAEVEACLIKSLLDAVGSSSFRLLTCIL